MTLHHLQTLLSFHPWLELQNTRAMYSASFRLLQSFKEACYYINRLFSGERDVQWTYELHSKGQCWWGWLFPLPSQGRSLDGRSLFGIHAKPHPALVRLHPPSQLRMGLLGEEKDFLGQRSNSQAASRSPAALQEGDSGGERGGDPSAIHFSWLLQADGEVEGGKASIWTRGAATTFPTCPWRPQRMDCEESSGCNEQHNLWRSSNQLPWKRIGTRRQIRTKELEVVQCSSKSLGWRRGECYVPDEIGHTELFFVNFNYTLPAWSLAITSSQL